MFARDFGFAERACYVQENEVNNPKYYVEAVSRCIKARAQKGYKLDVEASKNDCIVFQRVEGSFSISTDEAYRLASLVLGINEKRKKANNFQFSIKKI